jgi:hypothetical protein
MPIDPGQASDFVQAVGFPAAVALVAIALGAAALWFQHRSHTAELTRMLKAHDAALARAWDMFSSADDERKANGRELAEQLKTLDLALDLVQRQVVAR